jgi:hypothetical protein
MGLRPSTKISTAEGKPLTVSFPPQRSKLLAETDSTGTGSPALIYLSLVLGNLRNASLPSAKLHGMDLLLALSVHVMDQTRLDRVLPHLIDMLHDDEPIVRMAAARTVIQLVGKCRL